MTCFLVMMDRSALRLCTHVLSRALAIIRVVSGWKGVHPCAVRLKTHLRDVYQCRITNLITPFAIKVCSYFLYPTVTSCSPQGVNRVQNGVFVMWYRLILQRHFFDHHLPSCVVSCKIIYINNLLLVINC
jgi:hypothetical protein